MVRLSALPPGERQVLERLDCPTFQDTPWVTGPPLGARRIAMISSAGLLPRGERPGLARDARFKAIPDSMPDEAILCGHVSVNFDRTGMQGDLNCVLPRVPMRTLVEAGEIGALAETHYTFMGAVGHEVIERPARRLAGTLREQGVDTALLLPV